MTLRHLRVVFWIAFFLLGIELALEVRAVRRGWEAFLLGKEVGWNTQGDGSFGPTEDFPFRSSILRPEPDPGVERIWTASSSYGADALLEPDQLFPNLVGSLLSESGSPTQTLNCSVDGYTILRNVTDLGELGGRWKPDVVILYQMSNDIDQLSTGPGVSGPSGVEAASVGGGEAVGGPNRIHWLAEQMTVFKHLKSMVTSRLTRGRVLKDTLGDAGEAGFEARLAEFVATVRELGARPVLCTFATSHVRENLDGLPVEYELNLARFNMELSLEGWLDSVERYNRVIERFARDEHVLLVDLATPLAGRPELFRDFWHMRAPGHEIAARAIVDALNASPREGGAE